MPTKYTKLNRLIEFAITSAFEELMAKISTNAGKGFAAAKAGVPGAANKIQKVGTVGTHDVLTAAADIPKPSNLAWGGANADIQSSRTQSGVRSYLGSFNTGTQAQAALSAAQKAGMEQRGMRVAGGQAGASGVLGGATDWWNKQSPGRKLAIGAGAGVAAGYAGSALLSKDRNQQYSAWLDDIITFADPRPRNTLGEFQQQGEGGPNPNAMATVYKQPGMLASLAKGGTLALAGGAVGQVGGEFGKQATAKVKALLKKGKLKK